MKRRRAYNQEFDYWGVAAIGDFQFDDGLDKWDEIAQAFKLKQEINLKRSHDDTRIVGKIKSWDLDKCNKKAYIGFNKTDLDEDIKFDEINQVSIEYELDKDNKIIGIDHICVGNSFNQKCPKDVCTIIKQRSEPSGEPDKPEVPKVEDKVVPEEPKSEEIISKLQEEIKLLKTKVEVLSKPADKVEPEPKASDESKDKKPDIKLGFQEKLKHDLPTKDNNSKLGPTKWKFV